MLLEPGVCFIKLGLVIVITTIMVITMTVMIVMVVVVVMMMVVMMLVMVARWLLHLLGNRFRVEGLDVRENLNQNN